MRIADFHDCIRANDQATFFRLIQEAPRELFRQRGDQIYANWFSGRDATLLQLTAFLRPRFAERLLQLDVVADLPLDLHSACALGRVDRVRQILTDDPRQVQRNVDGYYPLQYGLGHPEIVQTLLEFGDDPNRLLTKLAWFDWEDEAAMHSWGGWRPLHMLALGRGDAPHVECGRILAEHGAKLNAGSSPLGMSPLHLATTCCRTHLIRWLVKTGSDVDQPTIMPGEGIQLAKLFDQAPFRPLTYPGQTPLMLALGEGHIDAVYTLLDLGANVRARDAGGFTPLHYASGPFWREQPELVKLLLTYGADHKAKSADGLSPEQLARARKYRATAVVLSSFGRFG